MWDNCHKTLYREKPVIFAESREKHSENILVGVIKKGVLITGTIRNRGGGLRTILSQEQLLHPSADISRFPLMVLNCHACVY